MGFHARDQSPISVFGWRGGGMLVVAKLLEMRRRLSYKDRQRRQYQPNW